MSTRSNWAQGIGTLSSLTGDLANVMAQSNNERMARERWEQELQLRREEQARQKAVSDATLQMAKDEADRKREAYEEQRITRASDVEMMKQYIDSLASGQPFTLPESITMQPETPGSLLATYGDEPELQYYKMGDSLPSSWMTPTGYMGQPEPSKYVNSYTPEESKPMESGGKDSLAELMGMDIQPYEDRFNPSSGALQSLLSQIITNKRAEERNENAWDMQNIRSESAKLKNEILERDKLEAGKRANETQDRSNKMFENLITRQDKAEETLQEKIKREEAEKLTKKEQERKDRAMNLFLAQLKFVNTREETKNSRGKSAGMQYINRDEKQIDALRKLGQVATDYGNDYDTVNSLYLSAVPEGIIKKTIPGKSGGYFGKDEPERVEETIDSKWTPYKKSLLPKQGKDESLNKIVAPADAETVKNEDTDEDIPEAMKSYMTDTNAKPGDVPQTSQTFPSKTPQENKAYEQEIENISAQIYKDVTDKNPPRTKEEANALAEKIVKSVEELSKSERPLDITANDFLPKRAMPTQQSPIGTVPKQPAYRSPIQQPTTFGKQAVELKNKAKRLAERFGETYLY